MVVETRIVYGDVNEVQQDALKSLKDFRANELFGGKIRSNEKIDFNSLTETQKNQIDLELGVLNENKFISKKKSEWSKENAGSLFNVFSNGNNNDERPEYQYGEGTKKPKLEERDEQYVVTITPNKTGVYINEKTSNDPDSFYIVYRGKETAIRINDGGIHLSTDHNSYQKITVNRDIVIDGTSSITVNGGNYDIYVNGTANFYSTEKFNVYTEQDINLTAAKNITLRYFQ